jgi:putative radical SAM enzyme (TIGR03279 family)
VRILTYKGLIARVVPDSIAEELKLQAGDTLLQVNGQPVQDIIDLSFALADDTVELLVEKTNGEQEVLEIEKEYDEDLGLEFESAVFDQVRRCANRCIFCFVDQMAPGMRESLYVKDDDYRLSFLYGNFVTLTNLTEQDLDRIRRFHLSPLYVSVHATDGKVREKMLNHRYAGRILEQLHMLMEYGIELHTQVVLCPGINDGKILEKTISDLYALYPQVLSMAIVPVGLSRFRDNCFPLEVFSAEQARQVIAQVVTWQKKCRKETGETFVYLADEFYLSAGEPVPDYELYDQFPQLENGIGMVRSFLHEWEEAGAVDGRYSEPHAIDVVCGLSAHKILQPLLESISVPNLSIRVIPVENVFFGPQITVSGLLTGQDVLHTLQQQSGGRSGVIVPGVALRKGENIFLDNKSCDDLEKALNVPVRAAYGAQDLKYLLGNWR